MKPLSRYSGFNVAPWVGVGGLKRALMVLLVGWLKHGTMPDEVSIPELLWYTVEEGIQKLGEIEISEWIYHIRFAHLPGRVTTTMRNKFVRGCTDSMKKSVIFLLCQIKVRIPLLSWDPSMQCK